jgi:uncharacterized membrane protein YoaK (UPF0700 family)
MSARDVSLALLALAAGSIDVLAFTRLGGALPSAMTGNTALLGLTLGRGHLRDAVPFLLAFGGFVAATATATGVCKAVSGTSESQRTIVRLLAGEAALLAGFAILWQFAARPMVGAARNSLILLAAAAMGIQGVTARSIGRPGLNTIVFTSTLSAIVSALTAAALRRPHGVFSDTRRQVYIFAIYFLGAALAGVAVMGRVDPIAALPLIAVLGAVICLYRPPAMLH